jgi:hypothetical protein
MRNHTRFAAALVALGKEMKRELSFTDAAALYDNYQCALYNSRYFNPIFNNSEYQR